MGPWTWIGVVVLGLVLVVGVEGVLGSVVGARV